MTPKERLKPVERKVLLSSILKSFMPGNRRMMRSTHIIDATVRQLYNNDPQDAARLPPKVHAVDPLAWISRVETIMHIAVRTYPRNDRHDPPAGIIVEAHVAFL
jgi:hypothetical protein